MFNKGDRRVTTQKIVSRYDSSKVLFECELPDGSESGMAMRDADLSGADLSGADLSGAVLRDADLSGADLSDADLSGANLSGAVLRDADLSGADLSGADLSGANLSATSEQSIENLDKVRAIILDNQSRLEMGHWHADDAWKERTCAEETLCSTTHCLAGWLQVCSTDPKLRALDAQTAGILAAPIAVKMFFRDAETVVTWLEERKYVAEIAESEKRKAERAAKKETT
jgi:Pentapeptide repeats (8 copies)